MSMTQTIIGGVIMVVVGSAALQGILPSPDPIVVHKLEYVDGNVLQDRSITADGPFYISWAAQVVFANTNTIVPWCAGSGANPYPPGHKVVNFPLDDWVGSAGCSQDSLLDGEYKLVAAWKWGDETTGAESSVFIIKDGVQVKGDDK